MPKNVYSSACHTSFPKVKYSEFNNYHHVPYNQCYVGTHHQLEKTVKKQEQAYSKMFCFTFEVSV